MELTWTASLSTGLFLHRPLLSALGPIKEAGFNTIEVAASSPHFDYHDAGLAARIRQELDSLGMRALSMHAPYGVNTDITALSEARRRFAVTEIEAAALALTRLGGANLVIHAGSESSEGREWAEPRLKQCARSLNELYRYCRELGLRLTFETMLGHLLGGNTEEMQWALAQLPLEGVGVCLDSGHSFLAGSLLERVSLFGPRLEILHLHDNEGAYDDHLPPGEGKIDWPGFMSALARARFSGEVVIEVSYAEGIIPRIKRSLVFLERCCMGTGCTLKMG